MDANVMDEAPSLVVTANVMEEASSLVVAQTVLKRKRTKSQRLLLPLSAPASSSTSTVCGSATEEEEDTANCLILLAQGQGLDGGSGGGRQTEKFTSRRFAEAATTTTDGKAGGFYVYQCKTCNKCFPSFQALGGHRASHKRPKIAVPAIVLDDADNRLVAAEHGLDLSMNSFSKPFIAPVAASNNTGKLKIHECSICGSEFSSGQALGGHMRRHRPAGVSANTAKKEEQSNVLSLDLNLPAPSDEAFTFAGKQTIVFSASALVDCHY